MQLKFSNDVRLDAEIRAHRRKVADRIESIGGTVTGMSKQATAQCAAWLRRDAKRGPVAAHRFGGRAR